MTKKELKSAQEKLKMLNNGKEATEKLTNEDCLGIYGLSKAQVLGNINTAITKTEREIYRHENPMSGVEKKLYEIAAKHMIMVRERGDLETRSSDSEDFFEVSACGLKAALKEAYEAGRKSK